MVEALLALLLKYLSRLELSYQVVQLVGCYYYFTVMSPKSTNTVVQVRSNFTASAPNPYPLSVAKLLKFVRQDIEFSLELYNVRYK